MPARSAIASHPDAPRPALPPRPKEFRTALEEEIKTAQADRSNLVQLTEGRFVAAVGGDYHYEFQTATPLRVPPDSPAELTVGGREAPVSVMVLEVEELKVTLACREHLGRVVPVARLRADLTMLLQRLIERIEQKAGEKWPTAERLLDGGPVTGREANFAGHDKLFPEQRSAVASALGRDLTFIWGPPGTGKTETIGVIGKELFTRGRTLLLVSHTNVAVDEAVERIAKLCDGSFAEGDIIRVGQPAKSELLGREDLICHRIAAKRSAALEAQRKALEQERQEGMVELRELERLVAVVEWAEEGAHDLQGLRASLASLHEAEAKLAVEGEEFTRRKPEQPAWEARARAAAGAQLAADRQTVAVCKREQLAPVIIHHQRGLSDAQAALSAARRLLVLSERAEPLRSRRRELGEMDTLSARVERTRRDAETCAANFTHQQTLAGNAQTLLERAASTNRISRLFRGLPDPEEQRRVAAKRDEDVGLTQRALAAAGEEHRVAVSNQREAGELDTALQSFADVPSLPSQQGVCRAQEVNEKAVRTRLEGYIEDLRRAMAAVEASERELAEFSRTYGGKPQELIRKAEEFREGTTTLAGSIERTQVVAGHTRREVDAQTRSLLAILREVKLTNAPDGPAGEMMAAIEAAYFQAVQMARTTPREKLARRRGNLSARVGQIDEETAAITDQLTRVVDDLILNAKVIATTLTRAFMRKAFQERRFDTVLCDEASMAPIPALWAAATLATKSVVAVGDFLQLPPIVQSDHTLAKRWLGRDVFEVSGVQVAYERGKPPAFFVPLRCQRRMHPDISDAPNALIYRGGLTNHDTLTAVDADNGLRSWHYAPPNLDQPLLLVDTTALGGWNNKSGHSRLNLLSACLCVRFAIACLRTDRPKWNRSEGSRLFIITPYRPQAALINLLLRERGINDGEVQARTAHSCQGGQADMVLVDFVVDQPTGRRP